MGEFAMSLFEKMEQKLTIKGIRNKLKKLIALDREEKVFGAQSHHYKLLPVLSEEQVQDFEIRNSIQLPEEYRLFLLHVSGGGAGPFYGLYALEQNDGIEPDLSAPFPYTCTNPMRMMDLYDSIPEDATDEENETILDEAYSTAGKGIIFLMTEGCAMYSVLVVNGKEYGTVWFYDLANDVGIFPLSSPKNGKPMHFFEWYELWLDSAIQSLTSGKSGMNSYSDFVR